MLLSQSRRAILVATAALILATSATSATSGCGLAPGAARSKGRSSAKPLALIIAPEDGTASVLNAMRAARRRVWLEMYMLTAPEAVEALRAASDAGCEVRVLLEAAPYGAPEANLPAFAALAGHGIDVRWIARPKGLVHAKLAIVDDVAYLMTMNLTVAGLGLNREFAIVDSDAGDLRWLQTVWNADAIGGDPGLPPAATRLVTSPIDARPRLTAMIDGARSSILVEIEEFSDAELVGRLIAARGRGAAVTVVAPASGRSAATTAALGRLADGGVVIRALEAPTVHAKAMVVDDRQAYVGSVNFTRASLDDNRETGILLDEGALVARLRTTITGDAARGTAAP